MSTVRVSVNSGGPGRLSAKNVTLALDEPHRIALELLTTFTMRSNMGDFMTPETIAANLFKNEIESRFEAITGMRLGELLARMRKGAKFAWVRSGDSLVLTEVFNSIQ